MRIAFIGSVHFSKVMLEKLIELKSEIVGIITKKESGFNSDFFDLSKIAIENNISFKYVNDINHPNNVAWIKELNADVIFCFGWSNLIKKEILELTEIGVIGYHPALLPNNKGRHPLIWAKVLGLKKTGSSFFFMDEGADSGDILNQKEFSIDFNDNANTLYHKMINCAVDQVTDFLPKLKNRNYIKTPQIGIGNTWRKRNANDGLIDFRMNSEVISNLVRGLSEPYPGAHFIFQNKEIKVWEISISDNCESNIEPGKVLNVNGNQVTVKTSNSQVTILRHTFNELPEIGEYLR